MSTTVSTPRKIAATATAGATLAKGAHTPVNVTASALTMTLPTDAAAGVVVSVEKVDASANTVTIAGTFRGVAGSSIALTSQFEARTFLSEGSGSWRPTSDHRTAASLLQGGQEQSAAPVKWRGVGRNVDRDRNPGFYVRGVNLGLGPNTIQTQVTWGASYDWAGYTKPNIDRIVSLGSNSIRIQGSYTAYSANPSQFVTRYKQVMDYCNASGLKVIYSFLNNLDDPSLASSNRAAYNTMIVDLATPYAGAAFLLGWDIGNELPLDFTPDYVTLATNFKTDLRAVDPTTKVTCSIGGTSSGLRITGITAADPIVDFHDLHIYATPQLRNGWSVNWLDQIRAATSKQFLIGEFGANRNGSGGGLPNVPDDYGQAKYVSSLLRFAGSPDCMGFMVWAVMDDNASFKFGLYDTAGSPRPVLEEWTKFPADRTAGAVATALLAARATPVIVDNFTRADASSVTAPPLGPVPVAQAGTWAQVSKHVEYTAAGGSVHTILTWDAKTADGVVQAEAMINNSGFNVGLVFRFVDTSNYWVAQFKTDGVRLYKNVAGTFTLVSSKITGFAQYAVQARVVLDGNNIFVYDRDKLMCSTATAGDAQHANATLHGIYEYPADESGKAWWHKFAFSVPLRGY